MNAEHQPAPSLQPPRLSQAVQRSVHGRRGDAKIIAEALNVPIARVYRVGDPIEREPVKAFWIPKLVEVSGSFEILDVLEESVGRNACLIGDDHTMPNDQSAREYVAVSLPRAIAERLQEFLRDGRTGQVRLNVHQGRLLNAEFSERVDGRSTKSQVEPGRKSVL